jgi:phospholipase/carboxylesterase
MASHQNGRIKSRPNAQRNLGSTTTGLRNTGMETERDGLLYVPETYNPKKSSALIVILHDANSDSHLGLAPLRALADRTGSILLAPESQGETWDALAGGFGEDVYFIDEALSDVFALYGVDPKHVAIAGFGDGGSYALTLGAANKDLFSHIMAFSPSAVMTTELRDAPPIYVSHGTKDEALAIDKTSRDLVPKLKASGLNITYEEFDGGHTLPQEITRSAFEWFLGSEALANTRGARVFATKSGLELT